MRFFDPSAAAIANDWHNRVLSDHQWSPESAPGSAGGIQQGYFVRSGDIRAFAKPSQPPSPLLGPTYTDNPVAAHEKIAADLAFKLGLPIPPALLWDRGQQRSGGYRHCV